MGDLRPGDSVEARMARLRNFSERDRIPLTVVAHDGRQLLGSASLIPHDMDTRMELTPWLAGVFVAPEHRGRGIGAALVRDIMAEAGQLSVPVLYLYTVHREKFYANLGWSLQEHSSYRNHNIATMTCQPTPDHDCRRLSQNRLEHAGSDRKRAYGASGFSKLGARSPLHWAIRMKTWDWSFCRRRSKRASFEVTRKSLRRPGSVGTKWQQTVRLDLIDRATLQSVMKIAWRKRAPKRLTSGDMA